MGWGSQIRSYVLQPYQMVKDLRTEVESRATSPRVLDGDLDEFMEGYLRWKRASAGDERRRWRRGARTGLTGFATARWYDAQPGQGGTAP